VAQLVALAQVDAGLKCNSHPQSDPKAQELGCSAAQCQGVELRGLARLREFQESGIATLRVPNPGIQPASQAVWPARALLRHRAGNLER
jgi:hypothetical protein